MLKMLTREAKDVLKHINAQKNGPEMIYCRSNVNKSLDLYMMKLHFYLPLKNCAHYGTIEYGLFRPRIYGNTAQLAN